MRYTGALTSLGKLFGRSTIYGRAGEHDTPYMTRIWFGRLRLHIFHRGDQDPDCHDHPWNFWTFPLTSYVEEVVTPSVAANYQNSDRSASVNRRVSERYVQVVKAFRFSYRPAEHCHRVLGRFNESYVGGVPVIDDRKIVTFVWRSGAERQWGFLKTRNGRWCWSPWREYVFGGGKDAPCSDD